jgi:hypothetical protein
MRNRKVQPLWCGEKEVPTIVEATSAVAARTVDLNCIVVCNLGGGGKKILGMSSMDYAEVYIRCPRTDSSSQGLIRSAERRRELPHVQPS